MATETEATVIEAFVTETLIEPVKVAKQFEAGLFIGKITAVNIKRGKKLYTVLYEDGDGEDMNDREYKEARSLYEQTKGASSTIVVTQTELEETEEDPLHSGGETEGSEFAPSDDEEGKNRRKTKRQQRKSPEKEKEKTKRRKTIKEVETKGRKQKNPGIDVEAILQSGSKDNITNKTVALMTDEEAASLTTTAGKAILQQAKKGLRVQAFKVTLFCPNMATVFICNRLCFSYPVKTKYTDMIREAPKTRLESSRIDIKDMVHVKVEIKKDITFTGTAGLTVGDWVEIEHDFSPGVNSGGGVAIITSIVENFSHVKYILDGHTEKFVPIKRLTCIPMPFRREKAVLRTRSVANEQPDEGMFRRFVLLFRFGKVPYNIDVCLADPLVHSKWRSMNVIQCQQHGLAQGLHKKEGWLWKVLKAEGIVPDTQAALRERCYDAYQSQNIFIMAQQQVMPEGCNPLEPMHSVKKAKSSGQFVSLQKIKNPVPSNVLTNSFLRFAFGVSKETFRRWMDEGREFVERIPFNKGENVIDDLKMAATYFSPRRLFMKHEMEQFKESPAGKHATLHERQKQKKYLKEQFNVLPEDVMEVYKKLLTKRWRCMDSSRRR